jgi:hypothetical protein
VIYRTIVGNCYSLLKRYDLALQYYLSDQIKDEFFSFPLSQLSTAERSSNSPSNILVSQSEITRCILQLFHQCIASSSSSVDMDPTTVSLESLASPLKELQIEEQLEACKKERELLIRLSYLHPLYGLHAYRLLLKLVFDELKLHEEKRDFLAVANNPSHFGIAREFHSKALYNVGRKKRRPSISSDNENTDHLPRFEVLRNPNKSDILNEVYLCSELSYEVSYLRLLGLWLLIVHCYFLSSFFC